MIIKKNCEKKIRESVYLRKTGPPPQSRAVRTFRETVANIVITTIIIIMFARVREHPRANNVVYLRTRTERERERDGRPDFFFHHEEKKIHKTPRRRSEFAVRDRFEFRTAAARFLDPLQTIRTVWGLARVRIKRICGNGPRTAVAVAARTCRRPSFVACPPTVARDPLTYTAKTYGSNEIQYSQ